MDLERKIVRFEAKAINDDGTFEGYGSVFNVQDFGNDIILPGAFAKTLAEHAAARTKPKMLWSHNANLIPVGTWPELSEDSHGLKVKGRLLLETTMGREVHIAMKAEAIDGLSIGYDTRNAEIEYDGDVRKIKSGIRLWEISPVVFPMNDAARITAVKSNFSAAGLADALRAAKRLDRLIKGAPANA